MKLSNNEVLLAVKQALQRLDSEIVVGYDKKRNEGTLHELIKKVSVHQQKWGWLEKWSNFVGVLIMMTAIVSVLMILFFSAGIIDTELSPTTFYGAIAFALIVDIYLGYLDRKYKRSLGEINDDIWALQSFLNSVKALRDKVDDESFLGKHWVFQHLKYLATKIVSNRADFDSLRVRNDRPIKQIIDAGKLLEDSTTKFEYYCQLVEKFDIYVDRKEIFQGL